MCSESVAQGDHVHNNSSGEEDEEDERKDMTSKLKDQGVTERTIKNILECGGQRKKNECYRLSNRTGHTNII